MDITQRKTSIFSRFSSWNSHERIVRVEARYVKTYFCLQCVELQFAPAGGVVVAVAVVVAVDGGSSCALGATYRVGGEPGSEINIIDAEITWEVVRISSIESVYHYVQF